jgi:hypothetical protein
VYGVPQVPEPTLKLLAYYWFKAKSLYLPAFELDWQPGFYCGLRDGEPAFEAIGVEGPVVTAEVGPEITPPVKIPVRVVA